MEGIKVAEINARQTNKKKQKAYNIHYGMIEKEPRTGSKEMLLRGSFVKGCYFRQVLTSGLLPHLRDDGNEQMILKIPAKSK